eukprot:PhF_6_TR40555/c0_g1_i1/m.60803/K00927/PGK, pgk; phosphoglycerate kinase
MSQVPSPWTTEAAKGARDHHIKGLMATLKKILVFGAKVLVLGHCDGDVTFGEIAAHIQSVIGIRDTKVIFIPNLAELIDYGHSSWNTNEVLIFDNITRHLPDELCEDDKEKQLRVARCFSPLCDVFVMECFPFSHRTTATTSVLPSLSRERCVGLGFASDLIAMSTVIAGSQKTALILGSVEALHDVQLLFNAVLLCDKLILLGSLEVSPDDAKTLLSFAERVRCEIIIPTDYVYVREKYKDGRPPSSQRRPTSAVVDARLKSPEGQVPIDIGPKTISKVKDLLKDVDHVLWYGCYAKYKECTALMGFENTSTKTILDMCFENAKQKGSQVYLMGDDVTYSVFQRIGGGGGVGDLKHLSSGNEVYLHLLKGVPLP